MQGSCQALILIYWISKEMLGEEIFQLRVATPSFVTCPMSFYKAKHKTSLYRSNNKLYSQATFTTWKKSKRKSFEDNEKKNNKKPPPKNNIHIFWP